MNRLSRFSALGLGAALILTGLYVLGRDSSKGAMIAATFVLLALWWGLR